MNVVASSAAGQRLNLQSTQAPAPGSGKVALALAEALDRECISLDSKRGTVSDAALDFSISVRRLARDLLRIGESLGEKGSVHVQTGRELASHAGEFDAMAGEGVHRVMLGAAVVALAVPAETLPRDAAGLDRLLREAFAPFVARLAPPPPRFGWVVTGDAASAEAGAPTGPLTAPRALDEATRNAVEKIDALLAIAHGHPSYAAAADQLREDTEAALLLLGAPPIWLGADASDRLRTEFRAIVEVLADPARRPEAVDAARRLGVLALWRKAATVASDLPESRASRIRARLTSTAMISDPLGADAARALTMFLSAADLASETASLVDENAVLRQLRPAHRVWADAAKQSEARLIDVLDAMFEPGADTQPAILSALTAHRRRLEDLRLLRLASAVIADSSGTEPREAYAALADRLLILARDSSRADPRGVASAALRDAAGQITAFFEVPGEDLFRDAAATDSEARTRLARIAGARATGVWPILERERSAWLIAWNDRNAPAPKPDRLLVLAELLAAVSALVDAEDTAVLQSWPGFFMSVAAGESLLAPARAIVLESTDAVLDGRWDAARAGLAGLTSEHAAALLLGEVSRSARAIGLRSPTGPGLTLHRLALGPPRRNAWMVEHRSAIASICRYAEELAAAPGAESARDLRAFLSRQARGVREATEQ